MRWNHALLLGLMAGLCASVSWAIPERSAGIALSALILAEWQGNDQSSQETGQFAEATEFYSDGEYQRCIESLQPLIRIIEARHGLFSTELIQPLKLKALAHRALKQYRQSTDVMTRAQHLTHRQQGMMTAEQLPMVFLKGLNLAQMDEWWQAEQVFKTGFRITRDRHGPSDEATVDAARLYGSWLTMAGRYKPALSLYREQLRELENLHGGPHPSMASIMKAKALTYLYERQTPERGLRLLRQRVAMMAHFSESYTPLQHYEALIELAQLQMRFGREQRALQTLETAWPWASELQRETISGDHEVWRGPFQFIAEGSKSRLWFDFEYELRADGRPQFIRLRDTNARPGQAHAAISLFRHMRMRPRLREGLAVPVARQQQRYMIQVTDPYRDELLAPVVNQMIRLITQATSVPIDQANQ